MKNFNVKLIMLLGVFLGFSEPVHAGFMSSRMAKGSVVAAIVASGIYFAINQYVKQSFGKLYIANVKAFYDSDAPLIGDPKFRGANFCQHRAFFKIIMNFISGLESDFLLWGGCDEFDRLINGLEGKKLAEAVVVDRSDVMLVKNCVLGSSYKAFSDWYQMYCAPAKEDSGGALVSMNVGDLKKNLKSYQAHVERDLRSLCRYASVSLEEINAVTNNRPALFDTDADLDTCAYLEDAQAGLCDYAGVDTLFKKIRGLRPGYLSYFGCNCLYNHRNVTDLIIWCVQVRKAIMQLRWIMLQLPSSCELLGAVACVPPGYE